MDQLKPVRQPAITLIKNILYIAFGSAFSRGIALLNTIIIAQLIGPAQYGVFAIFYTAMILTWQLPQSFDGVFVSLAKKTENKADKIEFLKSSLTFKLLYLTVVLVISYPLAILIGKYIFGKPNLNQPLILALVCGSFLTFLFTIASTYQEKERYGHFATIHAIYTGSIFVALIVMVLSKSKITLTAIFSIYLAISLGIGILSIYNLSIRVGTIRKINRSIFFRAFGQSKWMFFASATYCIFARIDILFLTRFVDYVSLGQYAIAAQLVTIIALAAGSLAGVCLPKASLAVKSEKDFRNYLIDCLFIIALILFGMIILYITAPYIVNFFYGEHYLPSIKIMRVLLIGWVFNIAYIPFSFLFLALERAQTKFAIELCKLAMCYVLLNIFVPIYGTIGAAYSFTLTLIVSTVITIILIKKRFHIFSNRAQISFNK
ncbi:MAG: oligosaccharide flippase family protein [Desulfobacteraceae bacterium]|nr:oligosaccharide flippase family protein [Desulfobacteraceae bacterium]